MPMQFGHTSLGIIVLARPLSSIHGSVAFVKLCGKRERFEAEVGKMADYCCVDKHV